MLIANDIRVRLGSKEILRGVTTSFAPAQVSVIVGPNGSGKTTLLRTLTAELPCTGQITLNGHDIGTTPAWKLAAIRAVLPQSTVLAFPFTVAEVVRLGQMGGIGAGGPDRTVEALNRVGLQNYGERFYSDLSGGEQQRVQLARVLLQVWRPVGSDGSPRWLILDEPVSSLDIGHQLMVMQIARDFADQGGGVVAVMHDLNLSAMFADHMVLMRDGRIAAQGLVREVLVDHHLSAAYGCDLRVGVAPPEQPLFVLPQAALTEV
ncbi:heme ABC transporter ATP-binding protein [Donghicola sp. C2-DW-16]|uniref:Heme ABC transporter ATP-binding protein n=1 Tax=Donghicola mangrovi TaxID=2729614 RepID=A0ABX2PGX6_9RHOB|nr:heme ABC transporter ATP-binding protein [Donghicola mangrovi]NVO28037.1 heme ABC transporter ATP-binding protein [Donghicola mangrovi]